MFDAGKITSKQFTLSSSGLFKPLPRGSDQEIDPFHLDQGPASQMSRFKPNTRSHYEPLRAESLAPRTWRKPPANVQPVYRKALILLGLVAAALFGLAFWLEPRLPSVQPSVSSSPQTALPAPSTLKSALAPAEYVPAPAKTVQKPRALADCIKAGNLIDESVLACRYGNVPTRREAKSDDGVLTPGTVGQRQVAAAPEMRQARASEPEGRDRAQVRQWDGKALYEAHWLFRGNRVDSGSVCANYRQGSIERRECRKGAKVYFKDRCVALSKQWDNQRSVPVHALRERFCSAAESFSPMS